MLLIRWTSTYFSEGREYLPANEESLWLLIHVICTILPPNEESLWLLINVIYTILPTNEESLWTPCTCNLYEVTSLYIYIPISSKQHVAKFSLVPNLYWDQFTRRKINLKRFIKKIILHCRYSKHLAQHFKICHQGTVMSFTMLNV